MLESLFNKVADMKHATLTKEDSNTGVFSVKFAKNFTTYFLTEHLQWLLLYHCNFHLYRLRILSTIPLDCNIISFGMYFSLVLFRAFRFLHPVKGLRIRLRPPDKF